MDSTFKYFTIDSSDYISELCINRADKSNAFNEECWEELAAAVQYLGVDNDTRVIILKGEGKNFSAGMDLQTLMSIPQRWQTDCEARKRESIGAFIRKIQDCISAIERCPVPVLASIHGACIGGALSIVTACDIRYCTADAYFSIRETDLGIVADIGVMQRMAHMVEPGVLAELSYTARNFDGVEAQKMGLVTRQYADIKQMEKAVRETAGQIAAKSPLVIRGLKKMMLYTRDHSVNEALDRVAEYNTAMLLSKDLTEAMMAYMEKRTAQF